MRAFGPDERLWIDDVASDVPSMASINSATFVKTPRRSRSVVMSRKKRSTMFSHLYSLKTGVACIAASLLVQWLNLDRQGALTAVSVCESAPALPDRLQPHRDRQTAARARQEGSGERNLRRGSSARPLEEVDFPLSLPGTASTVLRDRTPLLRSQMIRLRELATPSVGYGLPYLCKSLY